MKDKQIEYKNNKYNIKILSYKNNDRLCLKLMKDNECELDITINLNFLPSNSKEYIYINDICKETGLEEILLKQRLIEKVMTINCNYQILDLVKIDLDLLKEYDKAGYQLFEENYSKSKNIFNEIIDETKVIEFFNNDNNVFVTEGTDFVYISKEDIPNYLVSRNKDIEVYDNNGNLIIKTIGYFLDYIEPKLRKEIINELLDLQFNVKEPKMVNFVSPYVADTILYNNIEKEKSFSI